MRSQVTQVEADTPGHADALAVRRAVFVEGQGVPEALEVDDNEADSLHFVAYDGDSAVGAARLRPVEGAGGDGATRTAGDGTTNAAAGRTTNATVDETASEADDSAALATAKVERVAVVADRRGEGWGAALMDVVEAAARERGIEQLLLHAQTGVEGFYERRGYETTSEVFEEAGIPHVEMRRRLYSPV